ncbi:MAG: hypothetical protein DRO67_00455 [Candidatus Asgardarchaeum californiense]|nr:MAG: hypothetical protein DRO67_00455 [Candidatus Asgardarchaeum californiense]
MARGRRSISTQKKKEKKVNIQQGSGIRCPKCGESTHVNNSVPLPNKSIMRRYRECNACGHRFMTEEVIKRDTTPRKK